jgi:hypothetical protein
MDILIKSPSRKYTSDKLSQKLNDSKEFNENKDTKEQIKYL